MARKAGARQGPWVLGRHSPPEHLYEMTLDAYTRGPVAAPVADPLAPFGPAVRAWFEATFEAPTQAQAEGWAAIAQGHSTLIHAPTGSGKTLAAFLWCLDRLVEHPRPAPTRAEPGTVRVLYISPLKALTYDVERNLRAPLAGIALEAQRLGDEPPRITIAARTGDTPADARRDLVRHPPDILVTTPESLYLLLTSQAREILRGVEHVIVDEVHAIAGSKRGAHLALSLERLERLRATGSDGAGAADGSRGAGTADGSRGGGRGSSRGGGRVSSGDRGRGSSGDRGRGSAMAPLQRIGLSATQRPLETIARFLGGAGEGREVTIVDAGARKPLELQVVVPVEDMARLGEALPAEEQPGGPVLGGELRTSIWPAIHPRILELIRQHRSTIVFVNSRRLAERLAQRLNELAGEELVRAHHGSIAREQRLEIEEELKAGRLPALVATSSLELGIDMGAVDLVIQVESPTSVARGLQRIGRAGHHVGEPSKGVIFPKYRGDLLETAVVVKGMHDGSIETTTLPHNPLDVLAQQLVAMTIGERFTVDELLEIVRRAAPFETLAREALEGVLGMLAGAYPSDEFAELRPRITWDRLTDVIEGRRDARVVAVTSGGTIPDRGLYPVFLEGEPGTTGRRVGELDEEMVYELRAGMHGDVIVLGASSWRVADISPNRVTVTPAPGIPGKLPFWKGDSVGRPVELGRQIGAFVRAAEADLAAGPKGRAKATQRLRRDHDLDGLAAENLLAYLEDEREATGALPTDRRIVIERFRDELGDWRLVILTPFGGRVHAPWTMAIEARLQERLGLEVQTIWSDDGIAIRLPEGDATLDGVEELLFPDPEEIEDLVVGRVGHSSLFASRFRENAARALLLPRRRPGTRTPLWQQRQRAADLLAVASRYGSFPILVETYRECLADVFDLPALREILDGVRRREVVVHSVETARASAFASSLLFDYVAAYMYDGDAPLAERRAQALTLDRDLLRELLGQEELRELLDADALADLELSLQALVDERHADSPDHVHDLLRRLGDLSIEEVGARTVGGRVEGALHLAELASTRRAIRARIGGEERWIAMEDVARYRDGVGVSAPPGVPQAFLGPTIGALDGLLARYARTHGPFLAPDPARRWGLPTGRRRGGAPPAGRGGLAAQRGVPARRRGARVLRPRGPAAPPSPVALQAPARGGAGRPGHARAVPARVARRRPVTRRPRGVPHHRSEVPPRWSAWPRSSTSSRVCRSRPRSSSATCSRPASPAISRGCWTSSARWARSPGWGGGAWVATTGASSCTGRAARCCGRTAPRTAWTGRPRSSTSGSAPSSPAAAPPSTASCPPRRAAARTGRSSTRCGTWSGPARSPTTRSRRSGRCAGSDPPGITGRVRAGSRLSGRRRRRAAGRWWPTTPAPGPTRGRQPQPGPGSDRADGAGGRRHLRRPARRPAPSASTPRPWSSWSGTGSSPARRWPARPSTVASAPSTRCSGRWRRPAGSAAATSWTALARPSSLSPGPSTGCARCATSRGSWPASTGASSTCSRPPIPPTPTARLCPGPGGATPTGGPSSERPARTSCSSRGPPSCTWTAAGRRSRRCPRADDPAMLAAALRSLSDLVADGRVRELVISRVDGEPVAGSPFREALLAAGFVPGYRGVALRAGPPAERTYPRPTPVRPVR